MVGLGAAGVSARHRIIALGTLWGWWFTTAVIELTVINAVLHHWRLFVYDVIGEAVNPKPGTWILIAATCMATVWITAPASYRQAATSAGTTLASVVANGWRCATVVTARSGTLN